jgi:hypothetical protein
MRQTTALIGAWDGNENGFDIGERSFGWIEDYPRYRTGSALAIEGPTRAAHDNVNDKPDMADAHTVLLNASGDGYPQGYGPLNLHYRPVPQGGDVYDDGFAMFRQPIITTYYPLPGVDAVGFYGNRITVGETPVMVTHLGRWRESDNEQSHMLAIFRAERGPHDASDRPTGIVATVSVDASRAAETDGFNYARLEQPVVLRPGESYYLASLENTFAAFGGGDRFPSAGWTQSGIPDSPLFGSGFVVHQARNYTQTAQGDWVETNLNGGQFAPMVNIKIN